MTPSRKPPLRVMCQPVELGQTRTGLILAAAMVVLWLLAAPVRAAEQLVTGSSHDELLRIDWEYDLEEGTGSLRFLRSYGHPEWKLESLTSLHFLTLNTSLGSIRGNLGSVGISERAVFDIGDGLRAHSYGGFFGSAILPALVSFTFPTQGITVFETQIAYTGEFEVVPGVEWPTEGTLDFVSVQTIPEPRAAALGLVGAAAAAAAGRRRRRRSS